MATTKYRGLTIRERDGCEPRYYVSFTYRGVKCREVLDLQISPKNEKFAANLLGEVNNAIARGTFRYADFFPNSKKLAIFGKAQTKSRVKDYLDHHLAKLKRVGLKESTLSTYTYYVTAEFETLRDLRMTELTPIHIKNWLLSKTDDSKKTLENKLNFLRPALDEAIIDGLVTTNPARQISVSAYVGDLNAKERPAVDPFTPKEIEAILGAFRHEQERNLIEFAFETGLRTGELIGLKWEDIDWLNNQMKIVRAVVKQVVTTPKTKGGVRFVTLSPNALVALKRQREHTAIYRGWVFHDPHTADRWLSDQIIRKKCWKPALTRAKVRFRKPYNTRHTYATRHISRNANLWWLAKQMGHTSPAMLFKHYGSYIEEFSDVETAGQDTVRSLPISNKGNINDQYGN